MPLKTIKLCLSDEMIAHLDHRAELEGFTRSEFIRRSLAGEFQPLVRENFAATCAEVLKATSGKLSRAEVDHCVSIVIKGMAASSTK